MRIIKFRGKDRRTGEWFFGNYYDKDTSGRTHICNTSRGSLDILPDTVGQFTGVYDKNHNEIYEGDIIIERLKKARKFDDLYEIIFENCQWFGRNAYGNKTSLSLLEDFHEIKVVGNIHDNPELLINKK